MRGNRQRLVSLGASIFGVLTLVPAFMGQSFMGQSLPEATTGVHATTDWSSQHVVFSKPSTVEETERVQHDPRYWQQLYHRPEGNVPRPEAFRWAESDWLFGSNAELLGENRNGLWSQDMGAGASVGAMNYPAKFSFSLTVANCASATQPDFTIYGTGLTGAANQASIVAYDNLYSGCGGTVPTVYWAYNTGGRVTTSPVFSADGTQVAFVQTNAATGHGLVVLLKWAASTTETITNPLTLTRVANAAYPTCIAPCMTTTVLSDSSGTRTDDTNSSAFYVYAKDTLYVGDASGWLHQITGVFKGVPAEVRSAGWPVQVNSASPTALTSPVYDSSSGFVFVADQGGFLYRVGPNSAFVVASGQLDFSAAESGPGIAQSPVVDSTSESVYVFAASDGSGACAGGADCTAIYHLATAFSPGDTGAEAVVGNSTVSGTPPNPLYIGGFDSTYLNSLNATGNLYVCGNTGGPPTLYQVSVQAGALAFVITGPALSNSNTPCSPVSDFFNPSVAGGPAEWIFASAETGGLASACGAGGCIFNFKNTPWQPSTAYVIGQQVIDPHFQIQTVTVAGTSGSTAPSWQTIAGKTTTDGTVHWIDQGAQTATTPGAWVHNHVYSRGNKILDANKNVQLVTTAGTSGATIPAFNATPGATTSDGTVTWTNIGSIATSALATAGGTSGIIFDNAVGSGTLAGASQAYFSTLSNQACGTSGAGGCAMQASQTTLK